MWDFETENARETTADETQDILDDIHKMIVRENEAFVYHHKVSPHQCLDRKEETLLWSK